MIWLALIVNFSDGVLLLKEEISGFYLIYLIFWDPEISSWKSFVQKISPNPFYEISYSHNPT